MQFCWFRWTFLHFFLKLWIWDISLDISATCDGMQPYFRRYCCEQRQLLSTACLSLSCFTALCLHRQLSRWFCLKDHLECQAGISVKKLDFCFSPLKTSPLTTKPHLTPYIHNFSDFKSSFRGTTSKIQLNLVMNCRDQNERICARSNFLWKVSQAENRCLKPRLCHADCRL